MYGRRRRRKRTGTTYRWRVWRKSSSFKRITQMCFAGAALSTESISIIMQFIQISCLLNPPLLPPHLSPSISLLPSLSVSYAHRSQRHCYHLLIFYSSPPNVWAFVIIDGFNTTIPNKTCQQVIINYGNQSSAQARKNRVWNRKIKCQLNCNIVLGAVYCKLEIDGV